MHVSLSLDYRALLDVDTKFQDLLTLLYLLSAVVQFNSAFYHVTTAYMCRKQATI